MSRLLTAPTNECNEGTPVAKRKRKYDEFIEAAKSEIGLLRHDAHLVTKHTDLKHFLTVN